MTEEVKPSIHEMEGMKEPFLSYSEDNRTIELSNIEHRHFKDGSMSISLSLDGIDGQRDRPSQTVVACRSILIIFVGQLIWPLIMIFFFLCLFL